MAATELALLPPPLQHLAAVLLLLYVFTFQYPPFSPSLPAVLLSLSTGSPFSLLATVHLSVLLSLSPSLSLCHRSQTSPQAFLQRMLQLPSPSLFPQPLPLLTLFVCSRVPIKSCLCLIIAVIRRCANTCPAVCHQWSSTAQGHKGGRSGGGCQVDRQLFEMPFTGTTHTSYIDRFRAPQIAEA